MKNKQFRINQVVELAEIKYGHATLKLQNGKTITIPVEFFYFLYSEVEENVPEST